MVRENFRRVEAKLRKLPKRDLSQINFQGQHWWAERLKKRDGMTIDEEKAALIYEAMRRRAEVQKAWLEGKFTLGANGWQTFVGWVVQNLPKSWVELDKMSKGAIIHAIQSPWFIPPRGYSTFPDKSSPEQCRKVAMQVLRLPPSDEPAAAQGFVKHARKFADAGFLIVAVDNKTKQSVRYFGKTPAASLTLADCDKYLEWRTSGGYVAEFTVRGKPQTMQTSGGKRAVDLESVHYRKRLCLQNC